MAGGADDRRALRRHGAPASRDEAVAALGSALSAFRQAFRAAPPDEAQRLRAEASELLTEGATEYLAEVAPRLQARRRLSGGQARALGLSAGALLVGAALFPQAAALLLNALFLAFTLGVLALRAVVLRSSLGRTGRRPPPPLRDEDLPVVTILCPAYREAAGVPGLLRALALLDYPPDRLDVKLLLEADDSETLAVARRLTPAFPLDVVVVPDGGPRTKPKACNHGLWSARGDLLVIYDVEDRPDPRQLRRAAEAFAAAPADVVCLQARLNYYDRQRSWTTRLFAIEYALLFDLVLPGLDRLGAPLPLGGTSNVFRTDALIEVGGWDAYNVTEDADLGLRLARWGYRARTFASTTYESATPRPLPWMRQRSRWIKGYLQTWLVHVRALPPARRWRFALTLHLLVGAVVVAALLNPVFWTLFAVSLLHPSGGLDWLFPEPLGTMAALALLAGNGFQLWLFMLAPLRRGWLDLVVWGATAPFYWVLQSAAGYKAAWQFLSRPFYWEKTDHGAGEEAGTVHARMSTA